MMKNTEYIHLKNSIHKRKSTYHEKEVLSTEYKVIIMMKLGLPCSQTEKVFLQQGVNNKEKEQWQIINAL